MKTPVDIVTAARELIGTPYHHQGRLPGVGLDCIGVPIAVCRALGLGDFDFTAYTGEPDGTLIEEIEKVCQPIWRQIENELPSLELLKEGTLLVFKIRVLPQHCAIAATLRGKRSIIHAYQNAEKVDEHDLIAWWANRIVAIYALPGVSYGAI